MCYYLLNMYLSLKQRESDNTIFWYLYFSKFFTYIFLKFNTIDSVKNILKKYFLLKYYYINCSYHNT